LKHYRRLRLLLVLDDCGPGDALVVDFCLEAVLRAYPDAQTDLLVSKQAAPVFARDRRFRRVIISRLYEKRSRRRSVLVLRKLRELARLALDLGRTYDLTITFYWGTTLLNMLARWATRGRSLGYENGWRGLLDSRLGRYRPDGEPLEQAMRLLAEVGLEASPVVPAPRVDEGGLRRAEALLERHGLAGSSQLAVLHTGSDWACQQWEPERWAQLADWLAVELDMVVAFTGVLAEVGYVENIRQRMQASSISLLGSTSVADLAGLLKGAALCVCVDSLAFELAQAAGARTVVLAGQSRTEAANVGVRPPLLVNRAAPELRAAILTCKLSFQKASYGGCLHYGCPMAGLREIAVNDVMEAVRMVLGNRPRRVASSA
jgi:ADP-heptose:LPS heptosyltransferase